MIDISGASILVVDDTEANIDILVETLSDDYEISVALDGPGALESVEDDPPDLILLDIMMPGMDGYEVCRQLKADPRYRDIPVLFISALSDTGDKVKAFGTGGVDYVTKPFQTEEVRARVSTHLRLRQQQIEIEDQRRELQENYDKLRELEGLRDGLVHMIVHDMRSQLLGIYGTLELFREDIAGRLNEEELDDMNLAIKTTMGLNDMVTMLLDVSRMESGEMPLTKEPSDLCQVVDAAIGSLGALTKSCAVTFAPSDGPVTAVCDSEVVRRIVINLVGNSIKFTPSDGQVQISLTPQGGAVRVEVADTGPGIPPEYREKIFEKFGQVEGRQKGRGASTGLGLTFCKLAVEAHGGQIGVDSEVGKGSTFWFELPRNPETP